MKKKRLTSFLLAAIMMFSFLLSGCFNSNAAKKSADAFCSLIFKGETENLEKCGVAKSNNEQLLDKYKSEIKKQLKDNIGAWGGYSGGNDSDEIEKARLEKLSEVTFETKQVSKSGDTAEVEISTTYVDMKAAEEKAMIGALEEIQNTAFTSEHEEAKKLAETFSNKLPDAIRDTEVSTEKNTNTYKFIKKDKTWVPEDEENFRYMLVMQATNKDNLGLAINETRVTPEESAEIFWKLSTIADASGMTKLGYSNEFVEKFGQYVDTKLLVTFKEECVKDGINLSDEELKNMIAALKNAFSKNEVQFELVSKTDDIAKIKLTSTYINESQIIRDVLNKTRKDAIASGSSDMQKVMQIYCTNLIDGLNNAQTVSDPSNQITIEFAKVEDAWSPSNPEGLSKKISKLCVR